MRRFFRALFVARSPFQFRWCAVAIIIVCVSTADGSGRIIASVYQGARRSRASRGESWGRAFLRQTDVSDSFLGLCNYYERTAMQRLFIADHYYYCNKFRANLKGLVRLGCHHLFTVMSWQYGTRLSDKKKESIWVLWSHVMFWVWNRLKSRQSLTFCYPLWT